MAWKNSSITHEDGKTRCGWPDLDPLYIHYHDTDWGVPEYESRALFEKLMLDGFQAGLSWITILRKRDAFREAFDNFDAELIANYDDTKLASLMENAAIVRNRAKITASVGNARVFMEIEAAEGFDKYLWKYVDGAPLLNHWRDKSEVPAMTDIAEAISKDLKKRGFKFCGPTIVYAFMQAVGMVNDHLVDCYRHKECQALVQ